ncbi:MAG: hypothetical protein HQ453_05405 [Actinobacteria bacterium]|nr:hypothetical protein [Actinomycetota bacterium]
MPRTGSGRSAPWGSIRGARDLANLLRIRHLLALHPRSCLHAKGCTGIWRGNNKEVVDFDVTIGTYRNPGNGSSIPTSWGTVHYSKSGAHVVPAKPRPSRGGSKR